MGSLMGFSSHLQAQDTSAIQDTSLKTISAPVIDPQPEIQTGLEWNSLETTDTAFLVVIFLLLAAFMILLWGIETAILREKEMGWGAEKEGLAKKTAWQEKFGSNLNSFASNLTLVRKLFTYGGLLLFVGYFFYLLIKGKPLEGHVIEWLNLVIRWGHVVFAMAWIGTSFYFIFLENALDRGKGNREGLAGHLWAIHGGGYYYVEKFKNAPPKNPEKLHWFMWEAYLTWLSGFALITVVYYFNAKSMVIDKEVMDLSVGEAIAIGIGSMLISWFVYDGLCRTPLVRNKALFFTFLFGYLAVMALILTQLFSPRAAYIHVGAIIGTWMAGNVFRVIIPGQKIMVQRTQEGKSLDPAIGQAAGQRSLHNNYLTLPVIFIMISNHFPSTFGNHANWLILGGLTLASAGIKHYFNLKDKGEYNIWIMPVSILALIGLLFATAPRKTAPLAGAPTGKVEFYQAYKIMVKRCTQCHSATPSDDEFLVAPNGVMFDTPDQIVNLKDKIYARAVASNSMPNGNKTNMTKEEREILGRWIEQGARTD